jgi:hypothetical protein
MRYSGSSVCKASPRRTRATLYPTASAIPYPWIFLRFSSAPRRSPTFNFALSFLYYPCKRACKTVSYDDLEARSRRSVDNTGRLRVDSHHTKSRVREYSPLSRGLLVASGYRTKRIGILPWSKRSSPSYSGEQHEKNTCHACHRAQRQLEKTRGRTYDECVLCVTRLVRATAHWWKPFECTARHEITLAQ